MSSLFRIGQVLKGRAGNYTLAKEIQNNVWFAKNDLQQSVVIKTGLGHQNIQNERNVLARFQHRTPYLRPLIDEIEPNVPRTIVLRHLQSDLWDASISKKLNRKELRYVLRCVLEALKMLHGDGFVHTDIKPHNVFVNLKEGDMRFSEVQLGDLNGCVSADSERAITGTIVGAPIWTSPEVLMHLPWNTATDIWSFGAMLISLIYGGHFTLFHPEELKRGDEGYIDEVVEEQFKWFGPFPAKYAEIADEEAVLKILRIMKKIPKAKTTHFSRITVRDVSRTDNKFIQKIMKLDWRDRPTAKEILEDEWWSQDEEEQQIHQVHESSQVHQEEKPLYS